MGVLAIRIDRAASLIGAQKDKIEGNWKDYLFKAGDEEFISIFSLSKILRTTPQELIGLMEDIAMEDLIGETEGEETLDREEALKEYRKVTGNED